MIKRMLEFFSRMLLRYLEKPTGRYETAAVIDLEKLRRNLRPGDVLLVEGVSRLSAVIKYLTQSTWSHAALYVGPPPNGDDADRDLVLIEALAEDGVVRVPLEKYQGSHVRICRPVGLSDADCQTVLKFANDAIGYQYDLKNVFDLMRYLLPHPPVPLSMRRRMLALGSGDPTRAICSTLIARAFQSVQYPILPTVTVATSWTGSNYVEQELMHIRHHSLFAPRDFDLSPYFAVIKPTIAEGFDYKALNWADGAGEPPTGPEKIERAD